MCPFQHVLCRNGKWRLFFQIDSTLLWPVSHNARERPSSAWTFKFGRKRLQIFSKIHDKGFAFSVKFVNKNVRTHSTTVVNCFFRVAHREHYREENTSSIALNWARIEIKETLRNRTAEGRGRQKLIVWRAWQPDSWAIWRISGLRLPSSWRSRRENKLFEVVRKTWVFSYFYLYVNFYIRIFRLQPKLVRN